MSRLALSGVFLCKFEHNRYICFINSLLCYSPLCLTHIQIIKRSVFKMTIDIYVYLIVCPFVFLSGFVDAIAGGGGLISLPAYFISGLPTHFALGTNKLSAMLGTSITTYKYAKLGYINLKMAVIGVIFAFVGSSIGAKLALLVPDREFKIALIFILPLTAYYLLKNRNFG